MPDQPRSYRVLKQVTPQQRPHPSLADRLVHAAHRACDGGDLAMAWELLQVAEEAIHARDALQPGWQVSREMEAVVSGYRRVLLLRSSD